MEKKVNVTKIASEKEEKPTAVQTTLPIGEVANDASTKKEKVTEKEKETPKKEVQSTEKKEPVKKATKKPAKKKTTKAESTTTAKTEIPQEVFVQYAGQEIRMEDLIEKAKQAYVAEGHRGAGIKTVRLYVKPEEGMAYYVINDKASGGISLY